MKKLLVAMLLCTIASCSNRVNYEKPFVIIEKTPSDIYDSVARYVYQDKNHNRQVFYDNNCKYSIGDTIK